MSSPTPRSPEPGGARLRPPSARLRRAAPATPYGRGRAGGTPYGRTRALAGMIAMAGLLAACGGTGPDAGARSAASASAASPTSPTSPASPASPAVGAASPSPVPRATAVAHSLSVTGPDGKRITLRDRPRRIVCLTGICDDILVELGLVPAATTTPKLLTRPDYLGAAGAKVPVVPGSFGNEDVARIAELEPDLVIGLAGVHDQLRAAVERFAPLWVVKVDDHEDSVGYLRAVAALTGRGEAQAVAEDRFRARLAAARAEARARGLDRKTVLAMYGGSAVGVNTTDDVLGNFLSGFFRYPWPGKGGGFETAQAYSLEEILAKAPDMIFVQSFAFGPDARKVTDLYRDNPVWKRVPAVANGKVFEVAPELWASGRGTRAFGLIIGEAFARAAG
ncbi:ABC transporter substrate-binding protein [Bailinhaonella thermotolerans]|uniref:ABC transporter substrate-binding protein n=1 Tax=Bailinhaonella thermotolerans TaxID=1070861 RepID=A0A3A4ADV4_9ACTN|nr:ABC transporter substrate-binding protein [Bailinhaonella thermotolerans]RJL24230.1 ABC transporter substrate-binding protein [Bailinhaonella thermotolerans]